MDCAQYNAQDTNDFYDHLNRVQRQQRLPLSGSMELTFRCNLRCAHCYVGDQRSGDAQRAELDTAEIKRLLGEVSDAGCLWLLLTGGEPLVRPDFLEIYTYAKRKGFVISFFTNGTMLTPQIADVLAEYPPFLTEITLYGHTQATYERITGISGSHARCLRGIELLQQRGINLRLKTIAMSLNFHELQAMRQFADGLGVGFRFDPVLVPQLDGGRQPVALRLSPEEVIAADFTDPVRVQEYQDVNKRLGHVVPNPDRLYNCFAGVNAFHIDPYGMLSPCMLSRSQSFDLRQGSFTEGWNNFLAQVVSQPRLAATRCDGCKLLTVCGQCPGWASLENGNSQQTVDYLCQLAHMRQKIYGLNA